MAIVKVGHADGTARKEVMTRAVGQDRKGGQRGGRRDRFPPSAGIITFHLEYLHYSDSQLGHPAWMTFPRNATLRSHVDKAISGYASKSANVISSSSLSVGAPLIVPSS